MAFFDERVLAALKDGEPRSFTALLSQGGFSHNTLQQHLRRLMAQGLVLKEKETANGFGRPKFAYHIPSKTTNKSFLHLKTHVWNWWLSLLVALGPFADLKRAATAKKQRGTARLKFAPKSENKNYNHLTPIKGQASALFIKYQKRTTAVTLCFKIQQC